jgi:hypothetical protein
MSGHNLRWRFIPGYEDYYRVSDTGVVASVEREVARKDRLGRPSKRKVKNKILRTSISKTGGYEVVQLCMGGKAKHFMVHRLVMLAFVGPVPEGKEVNHKDFNPLNNRLENLEYVTHRENCLYSYEAGRYYYAEGEDCSSAKVTEEQVEEMTELKKQGMSYREMGKKYGISHTQARRICVRENWKHLDVK